MIELKEVVKTFDGLRALDGVNMHVPKGAVYGLVGPNGAGKSTVLRHITGVYRQDTGLVLMEGQPIFENPQAKGRIADIPDELYYFTAATTRDMMRFYRGFYRNFDVERYQALREVFSTVEETRPIRRLSKGMQKQSAFWLALCCRPDLLVLDEPVDGLDPVMRRQVWSLLLDDVLERGTTVLVSSHNLRELEDVCDHVGMLSKGKLLLERSLATLQESVIKVQIAFEDTDLPALPPEISLLHQSRVGRVHTLIVRGGAQETVERLRSLSPVLLDALPLSLEEIFIYELGGVDDAERKQVL